MTTGIISLTNGKKLLRFFDRNPLSLPLGKTTIKSKFMKDVLLINYRRILAGFWVLLALTSAIQLAWICPAGQVFLYVVLLFTACFPITTFLGGYLLPKALKTGNMKGFVLWFVAMTLLLAFFWALLDVVMSWLESSGIFPRSNAFSEWDEGRPFYGMYLGGLLSAFMTNLAFCALRFFNEHYRMAQEHANLQRAHLEDELRFLRSQINPHLMFNVLNHVHILMKKDADRAGDLLVRYSDVLRYQLYEANRETVSLSKEVDYLKDVVDVEKMRWGTELKVDCSWSIEDGAVEISPLLLIPFVENAFKHVSRLPSEVGYVNIALDQTGNTLRLVVENSRSGEAPRKKNASGLGMENVRKRLEILYPGRYELLVEKTDTIYKTTLTITL